MSRKAIRRPEASATDEQDRPGTPDGIPLGDSREDERTISGTYLPDRGVVALEGAESADVVEIDRVIEEIEVEAVAYVIGRLRRYSENARTDRHHRQ